MTDAFRFLHSLSPSLFRTAFAVCLFVLVLSAKWLTLERYGSAMPDWDQWDAEALETYVPWFDGKNFLGHLFNPHNEHRVVLTKLQNLALVLLNGQWDARLQTVVNAVLHALLAPVFWLLALRGLARGGIYPGFGNAPAVAAPAAPAPAASTFGGQVAAALLFLLAFALHGLPLAWQNVLGGFHSQQYWLSLLSFAAIVTLPFSRAFSAAWWLGAVSAVLVLGSMGSGFLAAFAVLIVLGYRLARRETAFPAAAPSLALCTAVVLLGILTRHEVPWHADMKAKSLQDIVLSLVKSAQWPWRDQHWAAFLLWAPWCLLAWRLCRAPAAPDADVRSATGSPVRSPARFPQAVLALGGWVLLQLGATAYARGAGADYPASRYMDILTFGAFANALALLCLRPAAPLSTLSSPSRFPLSASRGLQVFALAWSVTLAAGLYQYLAHTVRWELDGAKSYYTKAEGHLRRYLATDDPRHFAHPDIPFPSVEGLIERLAIPSLRALMPVPLRQPLALEPAAPPAGAATGFQRNRAIGADPERPPRLGLSPLTAPLDYTVTWGSYGPPANPAAATPATVGPAVFRSAPVPPLLSGWLRFEIAGDLGPAAGRDLSLALRDPQTDTLLGEVRPSRLPGDRWRSAYVRHPGRPFVVVATDASPAGWFAFSGPVEMGPLSYLGWQATRHSALIFQVSAAATLALAAGALFVFRRRAVSVA